LGGGGGWGQIAAEKSTIVSGITLRSVLKKARKSPQRGLETMGVLQNRIGGGGIPQCGQGKVFRIRGRSRGNMLEVSREGCRKEGRVAGSFPEEKLCNNRGWRV